MQCSLHQSGSKSDSDQQDETQYTKIIHRNKFAKNLADRMLFTSPSVHVHEQDKTKNKKKYREPNPLQKLTDRMLSSHFHMTVHTGGSKPVTNRTKCKTQKQYRGINSLKISPTECSLHLPVTMYTSGSKSAMYRP